MMTKAGGARLEAAPELADELHPLQIAFSRDPSQGALAKTLFEFAGEGIVIMDAASTQILEANPKACEIHGYEPGELVGLRVADLLPVPPDPEVVRRIRQALERTGRYESDSDLHRRKDGSLFCCGINLRQVALGRRTYKVAVYRDLTEQHRISEELRRVRAELERTVDRRTQELAQTSEALARQVAGRRSSEEALRNSKSHLRMLLTQLPAALWTTDGQLRFTSLTGAGLGGWRLRPGDLLGRSLEEAFGRGGMTDHALHHHRQALNGTPGSYVMLVNDRYYHSHVEALRDSEGRIVGVIGVSLDDTARLTAERAARESDARYRVIFERAPIGIGISQDRIVRYVNPAWVSMFGYQSAEEVLGTRFEEHLTEASRRELDESARRRARGEEVPSGAELVGVRKNGTTFDYHIESCRLMTPEGECVVALGTDVSERRRQDRVRQEAHEHLERLVAQRTADLARAAQNTRKAYDGLKAAQGQLIRSEKLASIGMLVSGVAHEINNPLSVILGNLQLLNEAKRLDEMCRGKGSPSGIQSRKIRGMLGDAYRAARRAEQIITTFRSFARDTRSAENVDINECLTETLEVIARQVPDRVRLEMHLGKIPSVPCFRGQINQVFLNLIQNAIEAIPGRGKVCVRTSKARGGIAVEFSDTGRGMTPEIQKQVFEPFFTTKPVGKGLGLGLSISAMIVQNHGGTISLRSRLARGTTFRVMLPGRPRGA